MSPVGPGARWMKKAPSPSSAQSRLSQRESNNSLMTLGALIDLLKEMLKKPTTMSFATVVVIDGAAKDALAGVNDPLCESIGVDTSTPLTSRIAPTAETEAARVHVYATGSAEPMTL
jgi:hypothetical protein